jgi:hypothetical protein
MTTGKPPDGHRHRPLSRRLHRDGFTPGPDTAAIAAHVLSHYEETDHG